MPKTIRFAPSAERDLTGLLAWSESQFGAAARKRYEALIALALGVLSNHPEPPGSHDRSELGPGVRSWHLRHARKLAGGGGKVRTPRHLLIYRRQASDIVVILRILHDAMEVTRHVPAAPEGTV